MAHISVGYKKDKITLFAVTWMDLEIIILNEVSQTQKDKQHIAYMWGLKKNEGTNEVITKTEVESEM